MSILYQKIFSRLWSVKIFSLIKNILMFNKEINFVIAGQAGEGVETTAKVLSKILSEMGYYTFHIPEYMSRIRGGCNSSLLKVSDENSPCFSEKIDFLFVLDHCAYEHLQDRTDENTVIVDESRKNFFVVGYVLALFQENLDLYLDLIKKYFPKYYTDGINISDFKMGYAKGQGHWIDLNIPKNRKKDEILLSGSESLSLGCIAGGCNFLTFYPMSPATPLQTHIAQNSEDFNIVCEQVEDEICAINMAIGAWYAGARAMTATSGGGFALMCEGVSLAAMLESPLVVNVAQRPAPATGLPTRTAQEDLDLVLYSGHGEFPRIIFAPATLQDAYYIGATAFNLADKYQVPVFILTDQAFVDSFCSCEKFSTDEVYEQKFITQSDKDYKRYKFSDSAISPRAIPSYGEGIVCVDSDEHDEAGLINENLQLRVKMVEKRLGKLDLIKQEILEPKFFGNEDYKYLIISWGSNYNTIKEVIKDKPDFAVLNFIQVYPLSENFLTHITKAEKLILVEQNATAQFGNLLYKEFGLKFDYNLLKYNGMPFSVEEIKRFIYEI